MFIYVFVYFLKPSSRELLAAVEVRVPRVQDLDQEV